MNQEEHAKRLYGYLKKEFPGLSDVKISKEVGASNSTISRLGRGLGIGVGVAKWMSENRTGYDEIYEDALDIENYIKEQTMAAIGGSKPIKREINTDGWSRNCLQMAGFVA